jgi:hypothetical protein
MNKMTLTLVIAAPLVLLFQNCAPSFVGLNNGTSHSVLVASVGDDQVNPTDEPSLDDPTFPPTTPTTPTTPINPTIPSGPGPVVNPKCSGGLNYSVDDYLRKAVAAIPTIDPVIAKMYFQVLGRRTAFYFDGAKYLTNLYHQGYTVESLRRDLVNEPDVASNINAIYFFYTGRNSTAEEVATVQSALNEGASLATNIEAPMYEQLCANQPKPVCENKNLTGITVESMRAVEEIPGIDAHIRAMYYDVLGMDIVNYIEGARYLTRLYQQGESLDSLRRALVNEPAVTARINFMYQSYLGRNATASELAETKTTLADIHNSLYFQVETILALKACKK